MGSISLSGFGFPHSIFISVHLSANLIISFSIAIYQVKGDYFRGIVTRVATAINMTKQVSVEWYWTFGHTSRSDINLVILCIVFFASCLFDVIYVSCICMDLPFLNLWVFSSMTLLKILKPESFLTIYAYNLKLGIFRVSHMFGTFLSWFFFSDYLLALFNFSTLPLSCVILPFTWSILLGKLLLEFSNWDF